MKPEVAAGGAAVRTLMVTAPSAAPEGTVVTICVPLLVKTLAAALPKVTSPPDKFVPVMVTESPAAALDGVTIVIVGGMVGGAFTVNEMVAGGTVLVVTTRLPAPAAAVNGTFVKICVAVLLKRGARTPRIVTLAPAKLLPLMVTGSPGAPLVVVLAVVIVGG